MQIQIYHTNDIHADFAFLGRVHAYLKANRRPQDLYFDSGDFTDLKSIVVQADRGASALELLRACRVDAMAVGNNEIDLGGEDLEKLVGHPLLCANLCHSDGTPVPRLRGSLTLERYGKRLLVIGLSPYYSARMAPNAYNVFFEMGSLRTTDPIAAAREILEAGGYDFSIILSHCGLKVDQMLRQQLPPVDLWLGGHSHSVVTENQYSQSGMGEKLGRITLEIDENGVRVTDSVQIDLPDCCDPQFERKLQKTQAFADRILSRELETAGELEFDPFRESPLTNFICDCLLDHCGGDLAVMHSGISEGSLKRPVSRRSLIENFPSKLNPTVCRVSGEKLLEAARLSLDETHIRRSGQGSGFRGTVLGCLGYSRNVAVTREPFAMSIDGKPVEPGRMYTLVTDDYLQRGTGYPSLAVPDEQARFDKWFIRDLVQHYLTREDLFQSALIHRVKE